MSERSGRSRTSTRPGILRVVTPPRPISGDSSRDAPFRGRGRTAPLQRMGTAAILAAFMPPAPPNPTPAPTAHWLTWPYRLLMLLFACAGFAAIWIVLAWSNDRQY